jgi:hypothetical protein
MLFVEGEAISGALTMEMISLDTVVRLDLTLKFIKPARHQFWS